MKTLSTSKRTTGDSGLLKFNGKPLLLSALHDMHRLPGQGINFDPMGVEADRESSGQLMFYNLNPHPVTRGADYLAEGLDPDSTEDNGRGSDGRAAMFTDVGQADITLELSCVVHDLSDVDIAVPDFTNPTPISKTAGGAWYIGPRSPATLCGPLMCIVPESDGKPSLGLSVELVSDFLGTNPTGTVSADTTGQFVLGKLNGGRTDQFEILETANAPSPMPADGDVLVFRCAVFAGVLNVWVDDVLIFEDVTVPAEMLGATKHGIIGRWPDADINTDLGFAYAPYTLTAPGQYALPRLTVSGKNLIRLAQPFRPFGVQPLHHDVIRDFFRDGGADDRSIIAKRMRWDREYGVNSVRIHLDLWDFVTGTSTDDLSMKPGAVANFLYYVREAQKNNIYVLVSGNNAWYIDNIPTWYDALPHRTRWNVQAFFFQGLAAAVLAAGLSTSVMGYELMSEPAITDDSGADWYVGDPELSDIYFVQYIARGVASGAASDTEARLWITQLRDAVKAADPDALVTLGALPSGGNFRATNTDDLLDFLSPHLYPPNSLFNPGTLASKKTIVDTWAASALPVIVGETVAWDDVNDNAEYYDYLFASVDGVVHFSWGYGPDKFTNEPYDFRFPATVDNVTRGAYEIHKFSLELLLEYRNAFVAGDL